MIPTTGTEIDERADLDSLHRQRVTSSIESEGSSVESADGCDADSTEKVEMLASALLDAGSREFRHVNVEIHSNIVMITGTVSSFYYKQMAQEVLRPMLFGMQIQNDLWVRD